MPPYLKFRQDLFDFAPAFWRVRSPDQSYRFFESHRGRDEPESDPSEIMRFEKRRSMRPSKVQLFYSVRTALIGAAGVLTVVGLTTPGAVAQTDETISGIVIGLSGALAATRILGTLLYEVKPSDRQTYLAGSALLVALATPASYFPVRRASRADPRVALRSELHFCPS
jgi:hypothetical protein